MATTHVNRAGTSLGTFSEDEVRQGLRSGRFVGTDLGWQEGMVSWQPLSQFSQFAADLAAAAATPAAPPIPAPAAVATPGPEAAATPVTTPSPAPVSTATTHAGLPWENRGGRSWFNAFIETLQMVLSRPAEAFGAMKPDGGLGDPLIYLLIGACSGAIVSFLFSFGLQSMGVAMGDRSSAFGSLVALGGVSFLILIFVPFGIVIAQFIGAAVLHVCLMIVGGANRPFETTFRVLAFSQGSTGVLQMIPVCGGMIALIWGIVVNCIGLARAHETDTWRAVVAVFLPMIVCGGCIVVAIMLGVAGALGSHSS